MGYKIGRKEVKVIRHEKRKSNTESLTSRLIYRISYYCGTEARVSDDEAHFFLC